MIPVVPALIPKSAAEVVIMLPTLRFSPEVHIDVVDGVFVPFSSWPYKPTGDPVEVRQVTDSFTLEVDLMVQDPQSAALSWVTAGADMLVFHIESFSLGDCQKFVRDTPAVSVSVAAGNDTPLESLLAYAPYVDGIQIMGISEIGAQGQPFDERVFARLQAIKEAFPLLPITIDGSVHEGTITRLAQAGADRFICGSAISKAPDPYAVYQSLTALANN
jgi:ribulose-phosphate 3-epimerase